MRNPQQLKNQWLTMGMDENNNKTVNTPQQIKNLGMMMKMKQSALERMTMTMKNKRKMKMTLEHKNKKKDAVAARRNKGGSHYKRTLYIYR